MRGSLFQHTSQLPHHLRLLDGASLRPCVALNLLFCVWFEIHPNDVYDLDSKKSVYGIYLYLYINLCVGCVGLSCAVFRT